MKIIRNRQGQGALEYIMISALIGVACLGVFNRFGNTLKSKMESIEKNVRSTIDMRRM